MATPTEGERERRFSAGAIEGGSRRGSCDSVWFAFPASCKDHDHLYHGPQVNNQVPPL